jgi:MFS superfamily sulfate permease-like transporter
METLNAQGLVVEDGTAASKTLTASPESREEKEYLERQKLKDEETPSKGWSAVRMAVRGQVSFINAKSLKRQDSGHFSSNDNEITLDLSHMTVVDSDGMAALQSIADQLRDQDRVVWNELTYSKEEFKSMPLKQLKRILNPPGVPSQAPTPSKDKEAGKPGGEDVELVSMNV